jgi:ABC-2 type transport system permease protein
MLRETLHVLSPKLLSLRAVARSRARGRGARVVLLGAVGALFWLFVFGVTLRLLTYFKNVPELGALLAAKLLGLVLLSFLGLLLLSNVITALSTFFLARDLDLLVGTPVDWLAVYAAKLSETLVSSSWMVVLMAFPIFTAYGIAYDGGWWYPLVAVAAVVPFLVIPAALGAAITLLLVNAFPARRTRDILSVITVLAAAGVILAFRLLRPERLARPEGFRSLVDFLAVLRTPSSPWLPSDWVQTGVLGWLRYEPDFFPFYLLWSTAAASVVGGAMLHRRWYAAGFSKSQQGSGRPAAVHGRVNAAALLGVLSATRRELILKELRIFFRDTTQWSQLILLVVLVVVYVFNIRFLPLRGEGITFFLANVVPFLNLVLAGFVLASIAARFIFPSVSLEGRTWWLLKSSPLSMRDLLWAKFWVGTLPLLVLALAIVFTTDVLLHVSEFMTIVSIGTITLLTFAISGLAIAAGTIFPQFETENAAQIPTSFGGLIFMMSAVSLIGAVIILEARPVYAYLSASAFGTPGEPAEMAIGFSAAAALCVAATLLPIRLAVRQLTALER